MPHPCSCEPLRRRTDDNDDDRRRPHPRRTSQRSERPWAHHPALRVGQSTIECREPIRLRTHGPAAAFGKASRMGSLRVHFTASKKRLRAEHRPATVELGSSRTVFSPATKAFLSQSSERMRTGDARSGTSAEQCATDISHGCVAPVSHLWPAKRTPAGGAARSGCCQEPRCASSPADSRCAPPPTPLGPTRAWTPTAG